jgi:hypothetical protein
MRRASSIFVLFVLLAFGLSLAVPVEDLPETAYDESEALLYERTPLFSIVVPLSAARTLQSWLSSFHLKVVVPSPFHASTCPDTGVHRSAHARISLALLCTLLC